MMYDKRKNAVYKNSKFANIDEEWHQQARVQLIVWARAVMCTTNNLRCN